MAHGCPAVREMFSWIGMRRRSPRPGSRHSPTTTSVSARARGAPRQCPAPSVQLTGYRDAIAWLGGHPSVDATRIGLWGSSFSGGEVIILASEELPIRCAVAQVPALGDGGPDLPAGSPRCHDRGSRTEPRRPDPPGRRRDTDGSASCSRTVPTTGSPGLPPNGTELAQRTESQRIVRAVPPDRSPGRRQDPATAGGCP